MTSGHRSQIGDLLIEFRKQLRKQRRDGLWGRRANLCKRLLDDSLFGHLSRRLGCGQRLGCDVLFHRRDQGGEAFSVAHSNVGKNFAVQVDAAQL